jgi:hypothetical protein
MNLPSILLWTRLTWLRKNWFYCLWALAVAGVVALWIFCYATRVADSTNGLLWQTNAQSKIDL